MKYVRNSEKIDNINKIFTFIWKITKKFNLKLLEFIIQKYAFIIMPISKMFFGFLLFFLPSLNLIMSIYCENYSFYKDIFSFRNSSYFLTVFTVFNFILSNNGFSM